MSSQTLLKIFAALALLASIAVFAIRYLTGEWADPWLVRGAVLLFAAALILSLIDPQTRPRLMLRFLSALFAVLSAIAFFADVSPHGVPEARSTWTSLLDYLTRLAPSLLAAIKGATTRALGAAVWDPLMLVILSVPAFALFAALAAIFGFTGRPRRDVKIYAN